MHLLALLLMIFASQANAQAFVPFSYWQNVSIPKLVQHKSNQAANKTVTATFTSNVTSGNMLIACSAQDINTTLTISDNNNNSWIPIAIENSSSGHSCWEVASAIAGATTVTLTAKTSVETMLAIFEVSGGYSVLDQWGFASGTTTAVSITTNGPIQSNTEYILAAAYDWTQNATWTQGAGYTLEEQINDATNGDSMGVEDKNVRTSLSGTQTATFTKTLNGDQWRGFILAFRQSPVVLLQAVSASNVMSQVTNFGASPESFTINSTGSGNLLVVVTQQSCLSASTQSLTDNAGNTYVNANAFCKASTAGAIEIWYAANSNPGATTISWTSNGVCGGSSFPNDFWFFEISGMAASSPLDVTAVTNSAASSSTVTAPTVTTTKTRDVVISAASVKNSIDTLSSNVFNQAFPVAEGDNASIYFPVATGSYGGGWIQSSSGTYCASTAAFKAK